MLEAIERYKSKRKCTKLLERIVGPTTEEDKKRRVREEEDITAIDERLRNLPLIIYLPNGSAEWSQRQEWQIWRAQIAEKQERIDEEEAIQKYVESSNATVANIEAEVKHYETTRWKHLR